MNRPLIPESPFLLGFEPMRELIDRAARAAGEAYPPFNVEDLGKGALRITLGVAGFLPGQLMVSVEGNHLSVTGKRADEPVPEVERNFLHRGIAERGFLRVFVLADGMHVDSARLSDGLLHVDLCRPIATGAVRNIPINAA